MLLFWSFRLLLLHFIFGQLNVHYVTATWPSSNSSNIQLLGLFQNTVNATTPTDLSVHSRAMFKAAVLLSQQYNITIQGRFIGWQAAQTGGNAIRALSDTCKAVLNSNIVGIVGPAFSRQAITIGEFGGRTGIPVISYSATDPDLSDRMTYPTFYRTVPSDNATALAIAKLFIRYNWTSCIIIYQNDAFGSSGAGVISDTLMNNDLAVIDTLTFSTGTLSFRDNLKSTLTNTATRIVVLWADLIYTPIILQQALDAGVLGPLFTWILSTTIPFDSFNDTSLPNLVGMLTVEPVTGAVVGAPINTTLLNAAYDLWQTYENETFPGSTNVSNYALFAFDATWALIQSLQQLCSTTINSSSCLSFVGTSNCFDRLLNQSDLLIDIINDVEFVGVSGPIQFSANVTDRINGAYYYAQNVQLSSNDTVFVSVLTYSAPENWKVPTGANAITWPGGSSVPPTGRASLNGVTLRVCITQSPPFTIVTNVIDSSGQTTQQYSGYVLDLIQSLQAEIGFTPIILLSPANATYDSLVQAVAHGVYDIWVGDVTVTSTRRQYVGFSNAIFENSLRLLMRQTPAVNYDLFGFLKPFSRNLWLLVLGACVYGGLLFCILERQDNEDLKDRSIVSQVPMSIWFSFGNIVGYGVDFDVSTAAGRLLTVGLYILSLILVASYVANLVSSLTLAKSQSVISGIDDIKSGKIPSNRIGIRVGTASEEYYLTEISNDVKNYYPLSSKQDGYNKLLANVIDVSFYDSGVSEYITNNVYCNLTLVGDGFDNGVFGIVTPRNWLYAQDLDVNVLALSESGVLDTLRAKWFDQKTCPDTAATTTALGIPALGGLFIVFAAISVLSILLFVWMKRNNIKNYLCKSACGKKCCCRRKDSAGRRSSQNFERAQKYELPSADFLHF